MKIYKICKLIKITETSYYRWIKKGKRKLKTNINNFLLDLIEKIFIENKGLYGAPRIRIVLLQKYQIKVSEKLVWKYMTNLGFKSFVRKKSIIKKPKEIKTNKQIFPNIVKRRWSEFEKNQLWVTDISYIPYNSKNFCYLSIIKDCKTGLILSAIISKINDIKLYKETLIQAEKFRDNKNNQLIIHSDNGYQYTSIFAQRYCQKNNIIISLSKPGNSLDNAMCETFFSSLKTEWLQKDDKTKNFEFIKNKINQYVEYYNFSRIRIKTKGTPYEAWCTL